MTKRESSKRRQDFLLSFFNKESRYQEKQINGFWLIKSYNGDTEDWQVAIYTKESYKKYKSYKLK